MLCGGQTCTDMELFGHAKRELLQSFLKLDHGIPSHDTFSRLLGMLDPAAFQQWFIGFMRQFAEGNEGILAVDGKTLRRSYDRAEQLSPLHLVSAWAEEQRLALGQLAVDDKSNEITALPKLLEMLTLRGKVVTADALHCQRQVAQQVIEQGSDYALALKAIKAVCGMIRSCFWKTRPRRWPRMSKSARDTGALKPASPASAPMWPGCKKRITGRACDWSKIVSWAK